MNIRIFLVAIVWICLALTNGIGQGKPLLQIENVDRDVGMIPRGEIIKQVFLLTNKGSGTLKILSVEHS